MATAKKAPAKKAPAKKSSVKPNPTPSVKPNLKAMSRPAKAMAPQQKFAMPVEVSNWIDQAMSRMSHMQSEIERLKRENAELKAYRKFAEHRILRSEAE
jgi:uncharacterized small protein (DUF1192 family)